MNQINLRCNKYVQYSSFTLFGLQLLQTEGRPLLLWCVDCRRLLLNHCSTINYSFQPITFQQLQANRRGHLSSICTKTSYTKVLMCSFQGSCFYPDQKEPLITVHFVEEADKPCPRPSRRPTGLCSSPVAAGRFPSLWWQNRSGQKRLQQHGEINKH